MLGFSKYQQVLIGITTFMDCSTLPVKTQQQLTFNHINKIPKKSNEIQ